MEAIPPEYLNTVVFLCVDRLTDGGNRRVPEATGFFVRVPIEGMTSFSADYVVTARHCIDEARDNGTLYVRLNRKAGGFIEVPTRIEDWHMHDCADVAAILTPRSSLPDGVEPSDLATASITLDSFVGPGPDYKHQVVVRPYGRNEVQPRVGHQVYFLGLFTEHFGEERNLPIARVGHIARMPNTLEIETRGTRFEIVAYLVELHSWGGHSGSPVFYMYPLVLQDVIELETSEGDRQTVTKSVDMSWVTGFMGLVTGHYNITQKAKKTGDIVGDVQVAMNSGIAIVTPAEAVTQLLLREDLVEERKKIGKEAEDNKPMPTLDSTEAKDSFTRNEFESAFRKVSRRLNPSEPDPCPSSLVP